MHERGGQNNKTQTHSFLPLTRRFNTGTSGCDNINTGKRCVYRNESN